VTDEMTTQAEIAKEARPPVRQRTPRRGLSRVMLFVACTLLMNGLFGERGFTEMLRVRRAYNDAIADLARLRRENATLRSEAERLRSDPATIETFARKDLGLLRPGEVLFTIHDLQR
jgi:cell division protein FtsB